MRIDVPEALLASAGSLDANAILLYVGLEPSTGSTSLLRVDDLRFLQWRSSSDLPDGFWGIDFVRSADGEAFEAALIVQ